MLLKLVRTEDLIFKYLSETYIIQNQCPYILTSSIRIYVSYAGQFYLSVRPAHVEPVYLV